MKSWIFCGRRLDPRVRGGSGETEKEEIPERRRKGEATEPLRSPELRPRGRMESDVILRRVIREDVRIPVGTVDLEAVLAVPDEPYGIVVFAHGSGSDRTNPRNQAVARTLQEAGLGTLLVDLLTPEEDRTGATRFNIRLLAGRLDAIAAWLRKRIGGPFPRIGYFGASTGASAAFLSAAGHPGIAAIVSRGGRPDLAAAVLPDVQAPSLLIVGEQDEPVASLNRDACELLPAECRLVVIPGATDLFEDPGALDQVARHAVDWFRRHLPERPLMP